MTRAADLAKLIAGSSTLGGTGELVLKDVDTADGSSPKITFQTGDTDIAQDDVLGTIDFQAPDEGTGTDAILVSAGVEAKAEGDFSSSSNATSLTFKTGSSEAAAEKMRIDSSGNVFIGKTSATISTDGLEFASGALGITRNDDTPLFLNRRSSDGSIQDFRKDNTTVGSISAVSSDLAIFSSASSHTGLRLANGYIAPTNNSGTISDNTADLGISNYRFKDLFLSGGAYIGGTGSANYLDDYEEGTFTPTTSTSGYTVSDSSATYTKVGRLVNLNVRMVFSAVNSSSNSNVNCNNVPFVKVAGDHAIGVGRETSTNGAMFVCQISQNTNVLHMNSMDGIGNNSQEAFQANKHYKFHIAFET